MKNFFKIFGIIALLAAIVFSMAGCQPWSDCPYCEGSGNCNSCKGRGYYQIHGGLRDGDFEQCPKCNGSGKCQNCDGSGKR